MIDAELKNKLIWQCRRGMLELDVILSPFLESYFEGLTADEQDKFQLLLKEADPDLYTWLMGYGECEKQELQEIVQTIRKKMEITA